MAGSVGIAGQRENHLIGGFTMATSATGPTESQSAVTLPGERIAAHAATLSTEGSGKSRRPSNKPKTPAEGRIRELLAERKISEKENEALSAENDALRVENLELRRQAAEVNSLQVEIAALEGREADWQRFALESAEAKDQAESRKQIDAEQRRGAALSQLVARSRQLAANSNYDAVLGKADGSFSTELLEQIMQFELGPQIAYRLALNPKLCQQLSQSPLTASALALVRIEAELQAEILKRNAEQTFLKVSGGWNAR
jgi:hypothetical protein